MNGVMFTSMEAALIANTERSGACPQRSEDSRRSASRCELRLTNAAQGQVVQTVMPAINFNSDSGAAITAPLPVGTTGKISTRQDA